MGKLDEYKKLHHFEEQQDWQITSSSAISCSYLKENKTGKIDKVLFSTKWWTKAGQEGRKGGVTIPGDPQILRQIAEKLNNTAQEIEDQETKK